MTGRLRACVPGGRSKAAWTAAALVLAILPCSAYATTPGANGSIAFEARPAGASRVASVTPNGALERQLASVEASLPGWSADGSRIAFDGRTPGGDGVLFTMAADGSDIAQLTTFGALFPAWSPDGSKVAFAEFTQAGNYDVFVMNANGTNPTDLTNNAAEDIWPAWSPDGAKIAFQSNRDGDREIYVMNANGSGVTDVSNRHLSEDEEPDWSPDGARIIFDSGGFNLPIDVYAMHADGTQVTPLTTSGKDSEPSWSPDGKQIAFVSTRDLNAEIYTMNADGTNPKRLTHNDYDDLFPSWQPLRVASLTQTAVAASPTPLVYGQAAALTASVQSGGATPTGLVQFAIDGENDGAPVALDALGHAQHDSGFLLDVGSAASATYGGDAHWGWSSDQLAVPVQPASTVTSLVTTPNPVAAGATADATVTVANTATDVTPFGSIQFAINGAAVGPRLELDENGQVAASLQANVPAGDYRVSVDYLDDTAPVADFVPSGASLIEHVTGPSANTAASAGAAATLSSPAAATPSRSALRRALAQYASRLSQALRARGLAALRQQGAVFAARTPGALVQRVYALASGHRTLLASGRHTFKAPAPARLRMRLTGAAKRLMHRARPVRVETDTSFTSPGAAPIVVTQRLTAGHGKTRAVIALGAVKAMSR